MSSEVSGNPPRFCLLGVCPEFSGLIPGWDPAVGFDKRSMLFQVCLGAVALWFFLHQDTCPSHVFGRFQLFSLSREVTARTAVLVEHIADGSGKRFVRCPDFPEQCCDTVFCLLLSFLYVAYTVLC